MPEHESRTTKSLLPHSTDSGVSDERGTSAHERVMFSCPGHAYSAIEAGWIGCRTARRLIEPETARSHRTRGRCRTSRPSRLAIERVDCSCLATTTCAARGPLTHVPRRSFRPCALRPLPPCSRPRCCSFSLHRGPPRPPGPRSAVRFGGARGPVGPRDHDRWRRRCHRHLE